MIMFYTWLHMAYAVLLCAALWLNRADWRTLCLSLVVAAGMFVPIPWTSNPSLWYFECFLVELMVICGALMLRSPTSWAIIVFSILLSSAHLTGVLYGPVRGIGPYRIIVPVLETGELLICCLLSCSMRRLIQRRTVLARLQKASHE